MSEPSSSLSSTRVRLDVTRARRVVFALLAGMLVTGSVWLNLMSLDRLDFPAALWRDKDDVPLTEDRRWARVRSALPERGVVGYVDEVDTRSGMSMAWYALAPLRLDEREAGGHQFIAVNATSDARLSEMARTLGGRVTARSGDGLGVVVLGGATQP